MVRGLLKGSGEANFVRRIVDYGGSEGGKLAGERAMVGCKFGVASRPGRIGLTVYTYINKKSFELEIV